MIIYPIRGSVFCTAPASWGASSERRELWRVMQMLDALPLTQPVCLNPTDVEKAAIAVSRNRTRDLVTARGRSVLEQHFELQKRYVHGELRQTLTASQAHAAALAGIRRADKLLGPLLEAIVLESADAMGRRVQIGFNAAKSVGRYPVRKEEDDELPPLSDPDPWRPAVTDWLDREGGARITQVSRTTQKMVTDALDIGIGLGEKPEFLTARIDALYLDQIIPNRSEVISRTESQFGTGFGGREAALSTGLSLLHEWLTAGDMRVRGRRPRDKFDHEEANGQRVPMSSTFTVSGEEFWFPGDQRTASAGNVIQCRCTEVYHVGE